MSESIAKRVGRIITGRVNMVIDAMENAAPEVLMEQTIREVDEVISEVRNELGREVANKHLAAKRLAEESRKHEELEAKSEVALREGREELAEMAIARQLDIEAQLPIFEQGISDCGSRERELEGYLLALQGKKRQMQDELHNYRESLRDAATTAVVKNGVANWPRSTSKARHAEAVFTRVMEHATGLAASRGELDSDSARMMSELNELTRKTTIRERLARTKERLAQ